MNSSFWCNRRVFLTGHTGFKGSWLLTWLLHLGAEVWTYSRSPEESPSLFSSLYPDIKTKPRWHHHVGDICDIEDLGSQIITAQPEVILHLAAQSLVRRSYFSPLETWSTNLLGRINLLETLRQLDGLCSVVFVTTDKVYENHNTCLGYRETDALGGCDPYSASKASAEIAISSWRSSFCGSLPHQYSNLRIATARAGNVIGGGDWSQDRLIPDAIRSLNQGLPIAIRNPMSSRPWQHVLEPLFGYLTLAEGMYKDPLLPCEAYNFGPHVTSNRSVLEVVDSIFDTWQGSYVDITDASAPYESSMLHLQRDKSYHFLEWLPRWDFHTSVSRTVSWYKNFYSGRTALDSIMDDISLYECS